MRYRMILIGIFVFLSFNINCFASTKTFVRSEDNLMVPKGVTVNKNNIDDILATPCVDSEEKLYDYADLFTTKEEVSIIKKLNSYIDDTSVDAVVVTVNDKLDISIDAYANNFYDYNYFKKNGIIFVVSTGGEEVEIYMGKIGDYSNKILRIYSDDRINQTLEYVYSYFATGNYNEGIDKYITILDGFYAREGSGNFKVDKNGNFKRNIPWIEMVILSFCLTFLIDVLLIYKFSLKNKSIKSYEKNINTSTLMIRTDEDKLIT